MEIERGFRGKLDDYLDINQPVCIKITAAGNAVYDSCCFGVDESEKLSDERYMVFYNQTASPQGEITYSAQGSENIYMVNLTALPENIAKLVFTLSIDGAGTMGEITSARIDIIQSGKNIIELTLSGKDFKNEKAIIGLEVYKKTVWRMNVIARGFDGGLDALLKNYGGELADEQPDKQPVSEQPASAPAVNDEKQLTDRIMNKINLSKDRINLEKHVINLSKCVIDLSKKSGVNLGSTSAKVVVALDYSYSMAQMYRSGVVQQTINKLVPLGLTFDDNGSIEVFLFQNDFYRTQPLDLSNYENYVKDVINTSGYRMGGTNYSPVLRAIIEGAEIKKDDFFGFGGTKEYVEPIVDDENTTFILFITDGENADHSETDKIIRKSSEKNVFIQFIGIGNDSFTYLRKLDDLSGRKRDNTGFSKMADLVSVSDEQLYNNVLEQFSGWLKGLR